MGFIIKHYNFSTMLVRVMGPVYGAMNMKLTTYLNYLFRPMETLFRKSRTWSWCSGFMCS